jgi:hypothetical protein
MCLLLSIDVSEEPIASIIKVTRIGEIGTRLAVISNRLTHDDILSSVTAFNCRHEKPEQSNLHHPSYFIKIHLNIINLPTYWSSQWSLSLWSCHPNLNAPLVSPIHATCPAPLILDLVIPPYSVFSTLQLLHSSSIQIF